MNYTKEEIQKSIDEKGFWEGISEEWHMGAFTRYFIRLENGLFEIEVICGVLQACGTELSCLEDAMMAIEILDSAVCAILQRMKPIPRKA